MKTRKPKIGGRYVAWMRGAFESVTVAPGKKAKPEAKAGAVNATRANVGETRAKSEAKPASV